MYDMNNVCNQLDFMYYLNNTSRS